MKKPQISNQPLPQETETKQVYFSRKEQISPTSLETYNHFLQGWAVFIWLYLTARNNYSESHVTLTFLDKEYSVVNKTSKKKRPNSNSVHKWESIKICILDSLKSWKSRIKVFCTFKLKFLILLSKIMKERPNSMCRARISPSMLSPVPILLLADFTGLSLSVVMTSRAEKCGQDWRTDSKSWN